MSFFIFNFSYLFGVFFLRILIIFIIIVYFRSMIYVKFLIVLVYVRGVVIFILYISCICWNFYGKINVLFLFSGVVRIYLKDDGLFVRFGLIGERL
jgi:hypothetical protein